MTARKGSLEKPAKLAAQAAVSLGNSHTGKARARVCAPIRSEAARQAPCRTFREHNAGAACGSRWGARTEQGNAKMQKANAFLRSPVNNCTPATGGQKWQKKQTESGLPSIAAIRAKEFQCLCKRFNTAVSNNPRRPAGGAARGIGILLRPFAPLLCLAQRCNFGTVMWRGIAVIVPNHRIHVLQLLLQITILRMISRSGQPFLKL